ncbi:cell division protein SepF [Miniphocaeibacter massiliensis]|uniref:cell division protein SepF n=1 Tax=Miniphocaeibacter massiliensis TaxID=2041841 RepID=UPI000C0846FB|nr:cell division protein SepF [Miniphocaeibacter massiliensis]
MADFFNKFKNLIGFGDDFDEDYDDDYYNEDYYDDRHYDAEPKETSEVKTESKKEESYDRFKKNNIVNIKESSATTDKVKIVVHEPIMFDDAPLVLNDILSKNVVVLNLEMLEMDNKRQIFDFVSGGIYAINGKIQKVTKDIFIIAPKGVEIDGKIKDQIQSKGFYQL